MTFYDGSKKVHHYFPKVHHVIDDYEDYDSIPETLIVDDSHELPYIGDFPPKDDYEKHRFY